MHRGLYTILALLTLAVSHLAQATALLVKTDGTAFTVSVHREAGDTVYYETQRSNGEQSLPKSEVAGIFERAASGVSDTYKIEEIDAILAEMDALSEELPDARRHIQGYAREYRKIKTRIEEASAALPSLELAIDVLVAEYTYSERDSETYTRVTTALQMVAYAEVNGTLNSKVESINKDIRKDFLNLNMARLREHAAGTSFSIGEFIAIKKLADSLNTAEPSQKEKREISRIIAWTRKGTYRQNLDAATTGLGDAPTIDQYLACNTILSKLEQHVATPDQKDALDTVRSAIFIKVGEANPEYDLTRTSFEGYPMTADDNMLVDTHGRFLTYMRGPNDGLDRNTAAAIAFPTEKIALAKLNEPLKLKLRLIYRFTPPADAQYRMVFRLSETRTAEIQDVAIVNGHGNGFVEVTFANLKANTMAALKRDAGASGRVNIDARIDASTNGGTSWQPQTLYMVLPLQIAEPEIYEYE